MSDIIPPPQGQTAPERTFPAPAAPDRTAEPPADLYACRVDLALTAHDLAVATARLQGAQAEVVTLTRLLAEAMAARRPEGDRPRGEPEALATTAARQRQQLDALGRDFAGQTRLLAAAEARARAAEEAGRDMAGWIGILGKVLLAGPDGRGLPDAALKAYARQLTDSGVIDSAWYLATHADVRAKGLDPALHFLRHGLAEGRSPRPPAPRPGSGQSGSAPSGSGQPGSARPSAGTAQADTARPGAAQSGTGHV